MIIHQIYTGNSLRNFNYIIACEDTKEALVIDPLTIDPILEIANHHQYKITRIINTHDHNDHIDGNIELVRITHAEVYCHANALDKIPKATHGLKSGDIIKFGNIKLKVLDTPGHTMAHVCILVYKNDKPFAIFSGDTLFNAGAGNCYSGNIDDLYDTFVKILFQLPDEVLVYPGHDYLENNLKFTLNREPDNNYASDLLRQTQNLAVNTFIITTLGIERQINTFFRLNNTSIIKNLDDLADTSPSEKAVFIALRELRNKW